MMSLSADKVSNSTPRYLDDLLNMIIHILKVCSNKFTQRNFN